MIDVRTTVSDTQTIAEAPPSPTHIAIRREDYQPPDWLVPEIALDFDLDADCTRVGARLEVTRNGNHDRPLRLDGDQLKLLLLKVNGLEVSPRIEGDQLIVDLEGDKAMVVTEVEIHPVTNTKLMGLYASGGML